MLEFDLINFLAGGENGHRINGQLPNDSQNSDSPATGKSANYQKSKLLRNCSADPRVEDPFCLFFYFDLRSDRRRITIVFRINQHQSTRAPHLVRSLSERIRARKSLLYIGIYRLL